MPRPDLVHPGLNNTHSQSPRLESKRGSRHLSGVRSGPKQQDMGRVSIPQLEPDGKSVFANRAYVQVPQLEFCRIVPCVPLVPALPSIPTIPLIPPVPQIQRVPQCNPTTLARVEAFGYWFGRNSEVITPAIEAHGMSLRGGVYEMYRKRMGIPTDQASPQNQPATSDTSQPVAAEGSQVAPAEVK